MDKLVDFERLIVLEYLRKNRVSFKVWLKGLSDKVSLW